MSIEPFEPNKVNLIDYLNAADLFPTLQESLDKLDEFKAQAEEDIANKDKEVASAQKKIDAIETTVGNIQSAIGELQSLITTGNTALNEIITTTANIGDVLDAPGIYLYGYAGKVKDFSSAISTQFSTGLKTPDGQGGSAVTQYGPDEVVGALVLLVGSDGGLYASGERLLKLAKLFQKDLGDLATLYEDSVAAVQQEFS